MDKQKGLTLMEISLALILSALFLAFSLKGQFSDMRKSTAQAQADQIKQIQTALNDYIEQHRSSIVNGISVPYPNSGADSEGKTAISTSGSNTLKQPTVEQLYLLGILPNAYANHISKLDELYDINLWVEPVGCTGQHCLVQGYVHTRDAMRLAGQTGDQYDGDGVLSVLDRLGGVGFASYTVGGDLVGVGGSFTFANPVAGKPPGVVGAAVSSEVNRDSINPIAGVDYCPGGLLYIPKSSQAATGTFYSKDKGDLQAWIAAQDSNGCILQFDDIQRGFTGMAVDVDPPKVGWTRLSCNADSSPGLVLADTGPANKACDGAYNGAASTTTTSIRVSPGST